MKKQKGKGSSRRGFIKVAVGGVAASLVDMTPVANAFQARVDIQRERNLIKLTIGETTMRLMDSSVTTAPDLVEIYYGLGGSSELTIQLLAETFGSRVVNREGAYPLEPGIAPDFERLTAALLDKARALEMDGARSGAGDARSPANVVLRAGGGTIMCPTPTPTPSPF